MGGCFSCLCDDDTGVEFSSVFEAKPDAPDEVDEPVEEKSETEQEEEFSTDNSGRFCDRSFPPIGRSIGGVTGDGANAAAQSALMAKLKFVIPGWGRPSQMLGENRTRKHELKLSETGVEPCLFRHTSPADVHQGGLGVRHTQPDSKTIARTTYEMKMAIVPENVMCVCVCVSVSGVPRR